MQDIMEKLDRSVGFLERKITLRPLAGIILGSGLGEAAGKMAVQASIPYGEIPGFPVATVAGHAGLLVFGSLGGRPAVVMQGRIHFYEGYSPREVVFPVWVMRRLGAQLLIVTNAAGGVNPSFTAGDLVLIKDHINLSGTNPLIGANLDEIGPRFPDLTNAYDRGLRQLAKRVASARGIQIKEGVYAQLTGPSYETPAEVSFLRAIGADQVGMSTAWETIAANHAGLKVIGISCIANKALRPDAEPVVHEEVLAVMRRASMRVADLIEGILIEDLDGLL